MKKLKKVLLYIGVGFAISIALFVYEKLTYFEPIEKIPIEASKVNASQTLDMYLQKDGCYEVGLSSYKNIFSNHKIDGKYKLQYFYKQELLEEKIIEKNIAFGVFGRTEYSTSLLDVIEVPHKGHNRLKIKLTVLRPEKIFENNESDVYLYINKSYYQCGKELAMKQKLNRISKLTIDTNETNETLIPLSKVLWGSNIEKVQQLIPSKFDVNVNMVANHKPLHYASYLNDERTVKYLIDNGAEIDIKDIQGHTPLYYAIKNNATNAVKLLMDSGADIKKVGNMYIYGYGEHTPLVYTTCNEYYELTEYLLQSDKVDNNEMSFGGNAYYRGASCLCKKYEISFYYLDGEHRYENVNHPNIKRMVDLLEKYDLKFEAKPIKFDEPIEQRNTAIKFMEKTFKNDLIQKRDETNTKNEETR